MSTIRVRSWHVVLVAIVATALVAATLAMSGAKAAETPVNAGVPLAAPYNEPIPAYDGYKGWGYVAGGLGQGTRLVAPAPRTAWYWSGYQWVQRSRSAGSQVYIWPYATGWSWTWTSSTGWLAMRTSDLQIGYRPIAIAT